MNREKQFVFTFDMSLQFLMLEPGLAEQWIERRREQFAKLRIMQGPRGGWYRLFTEPDAWTAKHDAFWNPDHVTYVSRRWGRYVPPSRITTEERLPDRAYGSFTIPVRKGRVILPGGGDVAVDDRFRFVDVPVPPADPRP